MTCRPRPLAVGWGVRRSGFIFLCLALGVAGARGAGKWITAQTDNFVLFSSASEAESRELLEDLERLRAVLRKGLNLPPAREPVTRVMAFSSRREFNHYKPLFEGKTKTDVVGYHSGGDDAAYIAIDLGSADRAKRTIYHEYLHHFFDLMGYKLPLWLNEGLADLFSTMQIKRNRLELGHAKIGYMNAMLSTWDLDWLFSVGKGSDSYHGGIAQQQFYAQSWALVHFWFCSPEMFPSYLKFLDLIENSGKDSAECMEEAFGMNTEQMKDALDAYLKKGRYQLRQLPLAEKPERKRYAFRRATDFEQELTLLNLEARALGLVESEIKLIELAERYPAEPRPYEILAALAGRKGKAQEQLDYYAKAVALGSLNSQVHVLRAGLALSRVDVGSSLDYRMPEDQAEPLRESLRTAFAANPNHDAIIDLLAYLESVAAKPKLSSVELVQKQVKGMRDSHEALLSLVVIRWRIKDHATAEAIVGMLRGRKPLEGGAMQRMELLEARLGLSATGAQ